MGTLPKSCGNTRSPPGLYAIHSIEYSFHIVNTAKLMERMFSLLNTWSRIGTSWALPGKILLLPCDEAKNPAFGILGARLSAFAAMLYLRAPARRWAFNCLGFLVSSLSCASPQSCEVNHGHHS